MNDASVYNRLRMWNFNGGNVTGGRWEDCLSHSFGLICPALEVRRSNFNNEREPNSKWFICLRLVASGSCSRLICAWEQFCTTFGPDSNILTTVEQIAVKLCTDIYGPQRINPTDSLWSSSSMSRSAFVIQTDKPLGQFDGIQCFFPCEHLRSESELGLLPSGFSHTSNLLQYGLATEKHKQYEL